MSESARISKHSSWRPAHYALTISPPVVITARLSQEISLCLSVFKLGAPRSMKMGTIRSLCLYDAATPRALQSA